jgi:hypothetical protein
MAQHDPERIKGPFGDLSPRVTAVIALRSALRFLPVFAERGGRDAELSDWQGEERARNALAIFRSCALSLAVNCQAAGEAFSGAAATLTAAREAVALVNSKRSTLVRAARETGMEQLARIVPPAVARTASARGEAILSDAAWVRQRRDAQPPGADGEQEQVTGLLALPLWPEGEPEEMRVLRMRFEADLLSLNAGFEIWLDWYSDRRNGKMPENWSRQCAMLSGDLFAQTPARINACLKGLRDASLRSGEAAALCGEAQDAEVFLSYSSKDGEAAKALFSELRRKRISVWYDAGLAAGQAFRDELRRRIEAAKAVVVLWTENSIGSKWVCSEASLADSHGKLVCLHDPKLDPNCAPLPFAEVHMTKLGDMPNLLKALALKGAKPKV